MGDINQQRWLDDAITNKWNKLGGSAAETDEQVPTWAEIDKAPGPDGNPAGFNISHYDAFFEQFIGDGNDIIPMPDYISNVTVSLFGDDTRPDNEARAQRIDELYIVLEKFPTLIKGLQNEEVDAKFSKTLFDLLGAIINLDPKYLPAILDPASNGALASKAWSRRYGFIVPNSSPYVHTFKGILLYTYINVGGQRKQSAVDKKDEKNNEKISRKSGMRKTLKLMTTPPPPPSEMTTKSSGSLNSENPHNAF